jgi:hypothetical protein
MHGLLGAIGRLLVMGLVMAAVLAASVFAGVAATSAIAMGIVVAGIVGLLGVARRGQRGRSSAHDEIAAMMAPHVPPPPVSQRTSVEAMAPRSEAPVDPEASMPRWRRPSLLEARHSDYADRAATTHVPMVFGGDRSDEAEVRVVRYAVVPVLDRPDEVLGVRRADLAAGDEVQVVGASGAFLEVLCPNGERGWIHRTTLGQHGGVGLPGGAHRVVHQEADDALTALLTARGLI